MSPQPTTWRLCAATGVLQQHQYSVPCCSNHDAVASQFVLAHRPFYGKFGLQDSKQTSCLAALQRNRSFYTCMLFVRPDVWSAPLMLLQGHAEGKETRGWRQGWQAQGWSTEVAGDWGASCQHAGSSPVSAFLLMLSSTLSSFIVASAC